jgi:hypothetical protein
MPADVRLFTADQGRRAVADCSSWPAVRAPAVLIRETAGRTQMRWPGILALALAAAILQAGCSTSHAAR